MRGWAIVGAVVLAGLILLLVSQDGAEGEGTKPLPAAASDTASAARAEALLEDERNTIEVFRRVSRSVVFITNKQLRRNLFSLNVMEIPRGSGSGFLWDRAGHVVTNFHVIAGGDLFSVTLHDGTNRDAELVGVEPNRDLAVLKIAPPRGLEPATIGESSSLVVGQKVLAVGNPFGLDQTLTTGIISALGREITSVTGTTIRDVIQTDASINPGNSGGPLLDSSGRVVGVNTAIVGPAGQSAGIGFAVPIDTVKLVVPDLVAYGEIKRAGLGVTILPDAVARQLGVSGVIVRDVAPGSAAEQAGLRSLEVDRLGRPRFDVIVEIDGKPIIRYDDLFAALEEREVGEEVRLGYQRGSRQHETKLRLQALN